MSNIIKLNFKKSILFVRVWIPFLHFTNLKRFISAMSSKHSKSRTLCIPKNCRVLVGLDSHYKAKAYFIFTEACILGIHSLAMILYWAATEGNTFVMFWHYKYISCYDTLIEQVQRETLSWCYGTTSIPRFWPYAPWFRSLT